MTFSLYVAGVGAVLLAEDGVTPLLAEDGTTFLLAEGGELSSAALLYGSITLKFNTLDFALIDAAIPALGAAVTTTDPAWSGTVAAVTTSDPVDLRNGHWITTVTATNTKPLPADTAPFDLSDVPGGSLATIDDETGSPIQEESGTDFAGNMQAEGALAYGYSGLTVRKTNTAPPVTLAICTVQQPGLRPGNLIHLTSQNQGYAAQALIVNQATLTWHGANPPVPVYVIEMGDTPQTLADWTLAHATPVVPALVPPAVIPVGPVTYGAASVGARFGAMGEGTVTVASATFSVVAPPGHTLTVQVQGAIDCITYAWDNYVAAPRRGVRAILSGGIYTGAWQETPFGYVRATYDVSSAAGIALAAGTYTVSLQINTVEYNQIQIYSGWVQAAVTVV